MLIADAEKEDRQEFRTLRSKDQILLTLQHRHYEIMFSERTDRCENSDERIRALYIPAWHSVGHEPIDFHPNAWNDILARFEVRTDASILINVDDTDTVWLTLTKLQTTGLNLPEAVGYMMGLASSVH